MRKYTFVTVEGITVSIKAESWEEAYDIYRKVVIKRV